MQSDGSLTDVFTFTGDWTSPLVAVAVHAGDDLRPSLEPLRTLDDDSRFREEDPFTDRIGHRLPALAVMHRSRFEVDLNRDREHAVYRSPDDCWGLDVWDGGEMPKAEVERSLAEYDAFYTALAERLDPLAARGPFVVYDLHSYNHRRGGHDAPIDPERDNPDVNVGTGSLDRERFAPVVDAFIASMSQATVEGAGIDVRENVRFQGANIAKWAHDRYPGRACVLALEFKKTFMDEWSGVRDEARIELLAIALADTVAPVLAALDEVRAA